MAVHEVDLDLSSPEYRRHAEDILKEFTRAGHAVVRARLHGVPVYLVVGMAAAKQVFEDARNFVFAPIGLPTREGLTEAMRAFVADGFQSQLVSAGYNDYRDLRKLINAAFKAAYADRAETVDRRAREHVAALVETLAPGSVDALALCRRYWLPLVADIIGIAALPQALLETLADWAQTLNEGYGYYGDRESMQQLAQAKTIVTDIIRQAVASQRVPAASALGYFLGEVEDEAAIDLARTFILGSINADRGVLVQQTRLLAEHRDQRLRFLAMTAEEQQQAMTELAAKEATVYYMPRFAVADVEVHGARIPAGACVHLAIHAINHCANPDFDITRHAAGACPAHRNETIPFGHARHRCPGETLARHLIPIFLDGCFRRFPEVSVLSCRRGPYPFTRSIDELLLDARHG